ncbi:LuxR C-terminal-related transcriptional regulator [Mesorhizobium sp. WSM3859]|uniref:LuxR C-terminal-related transcriptional regulator n=1 Tax=Mesorhizobium sp. WSM3859 TaxID=2029402 RepID=UPI001FE1E2F1|nr:LuxR C-terminal-related transcriptional regulator [Mesorhizobium sp. WSM3859]
MDCITLTPREFESLKWAARGKSAWDISQSLNAPRRSIWKTPRQSLACEPSTRAWRG